jgi:uncharacterized protein (DUF2267 family)
MKKILKTKCAKKKNYTTISLFIVTMLFSLILSACSGDDYGTKISFGENNELYYTTTVKEEEANKLIDYLVEQKFSAEDGNGITVQLNKTGSTYEFHMVVKEGLDQEEYVIDLMKEVGRELSQYVFDGEAVEVHLCDDTLTTLKVVLADNIGEDFGTELKFGENNQLYYTTNVKEEEAKALGDYLVKQEFFVEDGNNRSAQLNKNGSTYEFRIVVKTGLDQDQDTIDTMKVVAADLSENVFGGETVDIHLCDDTLETLRVVIY